MLKRKGLVVVLTFLLMIGAGSHAQAFEKQAQQTNTNSKENSKKEKESSGENELDKKPGKSVHRLDIFHAFSLVNAQLRWKEFHAEQLTTSSRSFSKKQKVTVQEAPDVTKLSDPDTPTANAVTAQANTNGTLCFSEIAQESSVVETNDSRTKIIAYILNCGTYPLSSL